MSRRLTFPQAMERARALRVRSFRADDLLTSEYTLHLHGHVYHWLAPMAGRWLREFVCEEGVDGPESWTQQVERKYQGFLRDRLARRSVDPDRKWPHLLRLPGAPTQG